MKPFSLLIKPTSADCNLRCTYCFYLEKRKLYPQSKVHRMSDGVLKQLVKTYLATEQPVYTFGWQGGEPSLMGDGFFKKVTAYQQRYARTGSVIANGFQTNATLITDALAEHLARYRFLVEYNGDIYPCDFYAQKDLRIGSVMDTTWQDALASPIYQNFGRRKSEWHANCQVCTYLERCMGDCLKHRGNNPMNTVGISHLCEGWQRFYGHTALSFNTLLEKIR